MKVYTIRIDEGVMEHIKRHAIPFEDKEPNDTLRRLFALDRDVTKPTDWGGPEIPPHLSSALQQILEVYRLVRRNGMDRKDATSEVAKKRNITYQSVVDKYTRQLVKKAHEIDRLMRPGEESENNFRFILEQRFPKYQKEIKAFFLKIYEKTDRLQT